MSDDTKAADVFDKFPNNAQVLPFNNARGYGVIVRWSFKGMGFGEFTIGVLKADGEPFVDKEAMSDDFCGKLMDLLKERGTLVSEARMVDLSPGLAVPDTIVAHPPHGATRPPGRKPCVMITRRR